MNASDIKEPRILEAKDLRISFTVNYTFIWSDRGSGARKNGAFWRPLLKDYYSLGDHCVGHYGAVNEIAPMVYDVNGSLGSALRKPTNYTQVWTDKGSGADLMGAMWRPIPPNGYVAMGLVCTERWNKPSLDVVRCIRKDLVIAAHVGDLIWNDRSSGADQDFSAWKIRAPNSTASEIYLAPETFIGRASYYEQPTGDAYALRLPPLQEDE